MDIYESAIRQRRRLEFMYKGAWRSVEPHAYGLNKKGNRVIRCYQVMGDSESGQSEGWKLMLVDEIGEASLGDEFLDVRDGYQPGDKGLAEIYAEL